MWAAIFETVGLVFQVDAAIADAGVPDWFALGVFDLYIFLHVITVWEGCDSRVG